MRVVKYPKKKVSGKVGLKDFLENFATKIGQVVVSLINMWVERGINLFLLIILMTMKEVCLSVL